MKLIVPLLAFVCVLTGFVSCKDRMDRPKGEGSKKSTVAGTDNDFIGLKEQAGASLAKKRNLEFRIVAVDGEMRPVTLDYRLDRISVELEKGLIVKVSRG